MNLEPKFYVYEHIRPDTGAVFYVGKGCDERAKNFASRSKKWKSIKQEAGGVEIRYPVVKADEELSFLAEMEYIDALRRRGVALINESNGGTGTTGWIPSEETRRKIGAANKHTPKATGKQHGMYGKKHTPESLAKISESRKGKMVGAQHPMFGKHHTEEIRRKISENCKGKQVGENNPFYGKTHTSEVLEKMRAAHLGRKASVETKTKMRDTHLQLAPESKLSKPVLCLTNGIEYYGLNEASKQLNLHRQSIRQVCNGTLKKTGGYKFQWSNK
jgi:hypothetical protein